MEFWLMLLAVIGLLFLLLALGVEIGIALAATGLLGLIFIGRSLFDVSLFSWQMSNSFILCALPLFIFLGNVFLYSGVTGYLYDGVIKWLGWLPAGLGCSVIGSCAVFAAISGSSPATAATIGTIALPYMRKDGYNDKLSCGILAAGGTLGILIPPSITMVIYGAWQGVSVIELFAGGIIPGIILASLFIIGLILVVTWRPSLAPGRVAASWKDRLFALAKIAPWLLLIFLILGGIFAGIMTPTEAAGVGALLSILFSLAYRRLNFNVIKRSAIDTLKITSMILLIICMARVVAFFVHWQGLGQILASTLLGLEVSKYLIISMIFFTYLVLGCFFETASMVVLTMPFYTPILEQLGFDFVWFGVALVILMEAGMITPPVGLNLYVIQGIAKKDIMVVALGAAPFLIPMLITVAIITAFPQLVLWLPSIIIG